MLEKGIEFCGSILIVDLCLRDLLNAFIRVLRHMWDACNNYEVWI